LILLELRVMEVVSGRQLEL